MSRWLVLGAVQARTTRLATFGGRIQAFADLFRREVKSMTVKFQMSTVVEQIKSNKGNWNWPSRGRKQLFDQVLVTSSPYQMARPRPEIAQRYLGSLLDLQSMGAVVLILCWSTPLSERGIYWFQLAQKSGFPFLALVEHIIFYPEHIWRWHKVYGGDYLDPDMNTSAFTKATTWTFFARIAQDPIPEFQVGLDQEELAMEDGVCTSLFLLWTIRKVFHPLLLQFLDCILQVWAR